MTDDFEDKIETAMRAHLNRNITSNDATTEEVIATTLLRAMPLLRDIAASLKSIDAAIAPDQEGRTVVDELRLISNALAAQKGLR